MLHGYLPQLLAGLWVTVKLALYALTAGTLLGFLLAWARLSTHKLLSMPVVFITTLIRGLPELIVLFLIYFGGQILLTQLVGHYIAINNFLAGVIALAIIFASYFCQTLRTAYMAIDSGQLLAAKAMGLNAWQQYWTIMLPQWVRYALPGFSNLCLVLLKDTAIISLIGLTDVMQASNNAQAATGDPLTFYTAVALLYLGLSSIILVSLRYLQTKMGMQQWTG